MHSKSSASKPAFRWPFEFRMGASGAGLYVGCGIGIGYLTPMSLHSIPVLGQIASSLQTSLRQVDAALGGAGGQVGRGLRRMRSFLPPGISTGAGCGVAVGYGWGVGLFVSETSMRAAMNSISSRVGQLNGSSTDSPVQQLSGPGSIRPAPIIPSAQSPVPPAPSDSDLLNLSKMLLKQQVVIDEMEKRLQVLEAKVPDPKAETGSNAHIRKALSGPLFTVLARPWIGRTRLIVGTTLSRTMLMVVGLERTGKAATAGFLLLFVAAAASYPVLYATRGPKVSVHDKALSKDATIRGAYINAGSRDVGRDPKVGTYYPKSQ